MIGGLSLGNSPGIVIYFSAMFLDTWIEERTLAHPSMQLTAAMVKLGKLKSLQRHRGFLDVCLGPPSSCNAMSKIILYFQHILSNSMRATKAKIYRRKYTWPEWCELKGRYHFNRILTIGTVFVKQVHFASWKRKFPLALERGMVTSFQIGKKDFALFFQLNHLSRENVRVLSHTPVSVSIR